MEKFLNRVIPLSGQLLVMLYLKNKNLQATRFLSLFFSFPSLCPPLFFSLCTFVSASLKNIESPLGSKEIKPVNPKGYQPWIFIGRTDTEAPILWSPDAKSQLIGKDLDAGKDWGQEEKRATEDEMVGWHHWLTGNEFEQTQKDSKGEGSLVCCSPWGHKELDMTERLNWTVC